MFEDAIRQVGGESRDAKLKEPGLEVKKEELNTKESLPVRKYRSVTDRVLGVFGVGSPSKS